LGEIEFKGRPTDEYNIKIPLDKAKGEADASPCRVLLQKEGKGKRRIKKKNVINGEKMIVITIIKQLY
jgi:hypothetical protein